MHLKKKYDSEYSILLDLLFLANLQGETIQDLLNKVDTNNIVSSSTNLLINLVISNGTLSNTLLGKTNTLLNNLLSATALNGMNNDLNLNEIKEQLTEFKETSILNTTFIANTVNEFKNSTDSNLSNIKANLTEFKQTTILNTTNISNTVKNFKASNDSNLLEISKKISNIKPSPTPGPTPSPTPPKPDPPVPPAPKYLWKYAYIADDYKIIVPFTCPSNEAHRFFDWCKHLDWYTHFRKPDEYGRDWWNYYNGHRKQCNPKYS